MNTALVIAPLVIAPFAIEAFVLARRRKRRQTRDEGTMAGVGVIDLRDSSNIIDLRDQPTSETPNHRVPPPSPASRPGSNDTTA